MPTNAAARTNPNDIILETPNFYMRRINVSDASERVGAWFEQPEVCEGLNLAPGRKSKSELEAWFASFDQHATSRSHGGEGEAQGIGAVWRNAFGKFLFGAFANFFCQLRLHHVAGAFFQ